MYIVYLSKKIPRKCLNILINYRMFFNHLSSNVAIIQTFFGEFDIGRTFLNTRHQRIFSFEKCP